MANQKCKRCGEEIELWGGGGKLWVHRGSERVFCSMDDDDNDNRAEPATPSGEVAQGEGSVHSKGSAVVQEQWERSKWSHDGNWRESLGDWAADLLTEYAAKYGPIDAAQPEPQPAGTEPEITAEDKATARTVAVAKFGEEYVADNEALVDMGIKSADYSEIRICIRYESMIAARNREFAALKQSHTQCVDALRALADALQRKERSKLLTINHDELMGLLVASRAALAAAAALESK